MDLVILPELYLWKNDWDYAVNVRSFRVSVWYGFESDFESVWFFTVFEAGEIVVKGDAIMVGIIRDVKILFKNK